MISIIPALEIMKSVTDNNIKSPAAEKRRKCFDEATELQTLCDCEVVLEGIIFEKVKERMNEDHKRVFENNYRIDCSAKGVESYNCTKATKWIAGKNSKISNVIIIAENPKDYELENERVVAMTPVNFMEKIAEVKSFIDNKKFLQFDKDITDVMINKAVELMFFNKNNED